jgi:hypothetical protein
MRIDEKIDKYIDDRTIDGELEKFRKNTKSSFEQLYLKVSRMKEFNKIKKYFGEADSAVADLIYMIEKTNIEGI